MDGKSFITDPVYTEWYRNRNTSSWLKCDELLIASLMKICCIRVNNFRTLFILSFSV